MITTITYRVDQIAEDAKGEILWVNTAGKFRSLELARNFLATHPSTSYTKGEVRHTYFTIMKVTEVTTTEITEEPVD